MISKPDGITLAAAQACWASAGVASTDTRAKPRRAISAAAFITRGSWPSGSTTLPPYRLARWINNSISAPC